MMFCYAMLCRAVLKQFSEASLECQVKKDKKQEFCDCNSRWHVSQGNNIPESKYSDMVMGIKLLKQVLLQETKVEYEGCGELVS
jgi:hypothetical protein